MKSIKGRTTYSFRFSNVCHPGLYKTFNVQRKRRHQSNGSYNHIGKQLLKYIEQCLYFETVVQEQNLSVTNLFVNQKEERVDIDLYFKDINIKITIIFEPGVPDRSFSKEILFN